MSVRDPVLRSLGWLALLGAPIACAGPRQEQIAGLEYAPTPMLQLIPPGGIPLPPAFENAIALFDRAGEQYRAGHRAEAADGFMAAAHALLGADAEGDPLGAIPNRVICYQNATYAFISAKERAGGKRKLAAAAAIDPKCADNIAPLIRELDAPPP